MIKVFIDADGEPRFLYHGLRGSRVVPLDQWVTAERKWVTEGSNPYYWSGFHAYRSLDDVRAWLRRCRIREGRAAVEIDCERVRPKPTAGEAMLAGAMRVTSGQWSRRVALNAF